MAAERSANWLRWNSGIVTVKVVARVESAVANELECRTVQHVGSGPGDDRDLRAVALAVAAP